MKTIISYIISTNIYNFIHPYIGKITFKLFKIFFVKTRFKELPEQNHPLNLKYDQELKKFNIYKKKDHIPFISYSHLIDLIKFYSNSIKKKKINFLDYGAGNLELFSSINNHIKKIDYYYYDQPIYRSLIKNIKKNNKLKQLNIIDDILKDKNKFDIVYFGGALQYIRNYKKEIKKIVKKSNYIIISQTPFFLNNKIKNDIVLKQVNLTKEINYLYLINFYEFILFMKKNNYYLITKNFNRVIKFINFKNFNKKFNQIDMYDLTFEKK